MNSLKDTLLFPHIKNLKSNLHLSNIVSNQIKCFRVSPPDLTSFLQKKINHVSAKDLTTFDPPTLKNHKNLSTIDQTIWDKAYAEEYYGLHSIPCWKTITEAEYRKIKHKSGPLLPTMAISTVK